MKTNIKSKPKISPPYIIGLAAVIIIGAGVWIWSHPSSKNTSDSQKTSPRASQEQSDNGPSPTASPLASTPTPATSSGSSGSTPSGGTLPAPSGQVLNTNEVSLSSVSGPDAPNMESTLLKGQPGASISVVATLNGGAEKTVATAGTIDASGEYSKPIDWNAKSVGLTPGSWSIRIKIALGGKTGYSQSDILVVKP